MKFQLSPHTLLAVATGITLTQSAIVAPIGKLNPTLAPVLASTKPAPKPATKPVAKTAKPSSNMVLPAVAKPVKPGVNIEKAKEAMFRDGDYVKAREYLTAALKTDPNEPLTYAMNSVYPFSSGDFEKVREYGEKTNQVAAKLATTNPLRANLYQGVGLAILGAYEMKRENGGALGALSNLQKVFGYMDKAKQLDPNNRELNLLKGYMDLLLAVNVPFSDTNQAIEQLQNAEPKYLAYRGIYIGHRDLKEYDKAIEAIEKAIQLAPNNPELTYYKAQIYAIRGREKKNDNDLKKSIQLFEVAYQKRDRLLIGTLVQILSERCQAKSALEKTSTDGCWEFDKQLKQDNPNLVVGLTKLPSLN
jgi:tetratricopeptide (TPR) repeat protein